MAIIYGVDASAANKPQKTGVEWYAYNLIQAMKKQALQNNERVFLYAPGPLAGALGELPAGFEEKVLRWPLRRGWLQGRLSYEMWRRPPQVLFIPGQGLPRKLPAGGTINTVHDVAFRRFPNLYSPEEVRHLEKVTVEAVARANYILTPSMATRDDLREFYGAEPGKLAVTPLAVNPAVYRQVPGAEVRAVWTKLNIEKPYFLFVGRLEAKKNLTTLLAAFHLWQKEFGETHELLLIGEPGFGYEAIAAAKKRLPYPTAVRELGYQAATTVNVLYNGAIALCFPSWAEGFGLPNLEAMAAGAPLIVSDIPAHREVVQNAALFVPPDQASEWVEAMSRVAANAHLRAALIERGRERVRDFSWAETARRTWEIFRTLV